MNWYLVKIIYQIISGKGLHKPQFDTQYRLIRADELEWAWEKATIVGRKGEEIFKNDRTEDVQWKFVAVEDVRPIDYLEDGEQVYDSLEEPANESEFITNTLMKSSRRFSMALNQTLAC